MTDLAPRHLAAVRQSTPMLKPEDRATLERGLQKSVWTEHPVNLRLSVPMPFGRFYLVILGGKERRSPERLQAERARHPLGTLGNVFFALGGAAVMYLAVAGLVLLGSAIIEF